MNYYTYVLTNFMNFIFAVSVLSGVLIWFVARLIKKQTKVGKYLKKLFEI